MAEILVGGTVLICMVLILRRLTLGRISMGMRYALWLVVALRMILPVSFGSSQFGMMNLAHGARMYLSDSAIGGWVERRIEGVADGVGDAVQVTDGSAADGVGDAAMGMDGLMADSAGHVAQAAGDAVADEVGRTAGRPGNSAADNIGNAAKVTDGSTVDGAGHMVQMTVDSTADGRTMSERQYMAGETDMPPEMRSDISGIETDRTGTDKAQLVSRYLRYGAFTLWILGMIAVGGAMLTGQVRFILWLRRNRVKAPTECMPDEWKHHMTEHGIQVWLMEGLPSPCMTGRGIYITPDLYEAEDERLHILAHEYAHVLQGDFLWALVRSLLCIVWWFHPLVWLAAYEARQDSELACDERAIRMLGETERFAYGRTLISLVTGENQRNGFTGLVLTMDGSGRRVRQRVDVIAAHRKTSGIVTGTVMLTAFLLCGCAFSGAETAQESDLTTDDESPMSAGEESAAMARESEEQRERMVAEVVSLQEAEDAAKAMEAQLLAAQAQIEAEEQRVQAEAAAMTQEVENAIKMEYTQIKAELAQLEKEKRQLKEKAEKLEEQAAQVQTALSQAESEEQKAEQVRIQAEQTQIKAEEQRVQAEIAALTAKAAQMQKQFEEIEKEWTQATKDEFEDLLWSMEDDVLASATMIDRMEYFDYLYNGGECPMEDGTWYLIYSNEKYGIDFYGLYTDKYGSRGVKIMIDGDVNRLDLPWRSAVFQSGVEVFVLERTQDGLPRTFAFKMCTKNTSTSEVWKLYLADRYDTGTIDLYAFDTEECQKQFQDMVSFQVDQENNKVLMIYDGDVVVGGIDISEYAEYTVEKVVWDGSVMGYQLGVDEESPITFTTSIGLKLAETDEIQYSGLSIIDCPVEIGEWGDRKFTLGGPTVNLQYVNGSLRTLK